MTEPVKTAKLGGLTYNVNEVKLAEKEEVNGKIMYILEFKSGETLTYPEQPVSVPSSREESTFAVDGDGTRYNKADYPYSIEHGEQKGVTYHRELKPDISQSIDKGWMYDDTYFSMTDICGATFSTHKDTVSHVTTETSYGCTIDLSANKSAWYGDDAEIIGGQNNTVILDDEDSAVIGGNDIEGKGEADQKDYQ